MKRVGLFLDRSKSCFRDIVDGIASFLDELPPPERWECWYDSYLDDPEVGPIMLDGAVTTVQVATDSARLANVAPVVVRVLGARRSPIRHPVIVCDDVAVGRVAATELLRRGHRDLAFVGNAHSDRSDSAVERAEGFREEAERAGVRFHAGPGTRSLREFLRTLPIPCGVLAMTDETGKFVLDACRAEGLRVPQDIAVLGVDNDLHNCELSWPPLASVEAGHFEVGYRAAERLHALMQGRIDPALPDVERAGMPEVIVRASIDTQAVDDELVARALQWIKAQAHEAVSVSDLCEQLGAARRSLEMRFRRATGRSILQELHSTRVQSAKRLLRNRRLSIEQVARLSGFGTQTHLGVIFRRLVGMTPSAYRGQALRA